MQVYVDDPLVGIVAEAQRVKRLACVISAAWMIMGFPLAFHKATLARKLVWIGIQLEVQQDSVIAEVPKEKVAELNQLLRDLLRDNVVSLKVLRTITGKLTSVASVIQVWRPFVQQLYKAMQVTDTRAPKGCVWVKQISHTVEWLLTFLAGENLGIRREFTLAAYLRKGPTVVITWDASPHGMGATLQISGKFISFFAIPIADDDQEILQTPSGDCKGQQVWEALAGLVALRLWSPHWQHFPVVLQVRNDNMGALTLFSTIRGISTALSIIAREFALDLGRATCKPSLVQHIPGITNKHVMPCLEGMIPTSPLSCPNACCMQNRWFRHPGLEHGGNLYSWQDSDRLRLHQVPVTPGADIGGDRSRSPRR